MRQAPKLPKRAQPESPNLQSTFRPSARSRQHGTRSAEFFHVQLQSQKRNCSFVSFKQQSQDRHEFVRQVSTTPKTVTNGRTDLTSPHSSSLEVAVLMKPLPSQPSHHPTIPPTPCIGPCYLRRSNPQGSGALINGSRLPPLVSGHPCLPQPTGSFTFNQRWLRVRPPCRSRTLECHPPPHGFAPLAFCHRFRLVFRHGNLSRLRFVCPG